MFAHFTHLSDKRHPKSKTKNRRFRSIKTLSLSLPGLDCLCQRVRLPVNFAGPMSFFWFVLFQQNSFLTENRLPSSLGTACSMNDPGECLSISSNQEKCISNIVCSSFYPSSKKGRVPGIRLMAFSISKLQNSVKRSTSHSGWLVQRESGVLIRVSKKDFWLQILGVFQTFTEKLEKLWHSTAFGENRSANFNWIDKEIESLERWLLIHLGVPSRQALLFRESDFRPKEALDLIENCLKWSTLMLTNWSTNLFLRSPQTQRSPVGRLNSFHCEAFTSLYSDVWFTLISLGRRTREVGDDKMGTVFVELDRTNAI